MGHTWSAGRRAGILSGTGAVVLFLLWRRLRAPARMPYRTQWNHMLARRYGTTTANQCVDRPGQIIRELCAGYSFPRHLMLHYHVTWQILPALAMYRTLVEELEDSLIARDVVSQLVWQELRPIYRIATASFAPLPAPFPFWRMLVQIAMKTIFPPSGWRTRPAANTARCFGFDIVGCVYLDILRTLGAPELAPIFCQMDDRLAQLIPSSIGWRRAGTLARGQDRCDFRWINRGRREQS